MAVWVFSAHSSGPDDSLRFDVQSVWGIRGAQPGELHFPRAVEIGPDGSLYIVDRSGRIQRYSPEGRLILAWSLPAWENGTPTGLGMSAAGELLVANCHYSSILVYSPDGTLLRQFGEYGLEPGKLVFPTDVTVDKDGFIYVVDYGSWRDKVVKFDPEGRYIMEWGSCGEGPGQLQRAMSIVCAPDQRLWVADSGNDRLQVFDRDGNHLQTIGGRGREIGELRFPYDLAVGPDGSILAIEYGNNRLQIFSPDGESLGVIGMAGRGPGQFASPWGVDCDPAGNVWVADTMNHRMQLLRIAGLRG